MSGFGGSTFSFGNNNNQSSAFGGSGGFGNNNNNNNTASAFGSGTGTTFGAATNNTGGIFGSGGTGNTTFGNSAGAGFGTSGNNATGAGLFQNKPGGFGSTNTGSGLFGSSTTNNNNTGFGSSTTAFGGGNTTTSAFGSNNASTGGAFGGFGANNNNTNTTSAFGSTPAKSLFGAGGVGTTGGFGTTNTSPFSGSGTALGGVLPPCPGTGDVQFQPVSEKESNGQTVNYQTISFQQPYAKYSLEELRLADYEKGRQFGNGGAFGATNFSTGFGNTTGSGTAFGGANTNTTGGLFGSAATSGGAFGSNTATAGGFGASNNAAGGLFGQAKPAGGLFGQQTSASTSGGLFGTSTNNSTAGGGLFGSNNNQQQSGGLFGGTQSKPGGLFGGGGNSTNTATTGGLFGNNNQQSGTTGGGLFGGTGATPATGASLFGNANNNQQQASAGGGLFGNNSQNTGGGLFGNKPAPFGASTTQNQPSGGLFGGTNNNASGGLFGNQQQNNTAGGSGGLFGNVNTSNNQQSGGLFGQTQNKPAGGLFGNAGTTAGGGLFGNTAANNNQQNGGLFGNSNNNAGGGLFGQQNQNKPSGLFGTASANNNQQGTSLFGNTLNSGLFGQSQNNQQQQNLNQQEVKHASLLDPNPYGQSSIWTGLPAPTIDNSKPVFTPLTATKKLEESARKPLPTMRLNQSRYMTPPRRSGYGLSYSTYGTPNSAASTPGGASLSGSMYGGKGWAGGSFGRSFNRSASVQNLRTHYSSDADDIWKPNAFAPSHRNSGGSIKRLTIDRSIRQDLFNRPPPVPALLPPPSTNDEHNKTSSAQLINEQPQAQKKDKHVSFETQTATMNGETGALTPIADSSGEDSTPPPTNGASKNDLQSVPEDRESHPVSSKTPTGGLRPDPSPGTYWMKPSRQDMAKMSKEELENYQGFQVGRHGCGFVTFNTKVDLTKLNLDELFGKTVKIEVRKITVYEEPDPKPPVGKGLNVPSTLLIENAWPRGPKGKPSSDTSGPVLEKHIKHLKNSKGTEFVSYDAHTGAWTFNVPHYTTYGLDYDEDEASTMDQSELSLPPHSIEKSADASVMEVDYQSDSNDEDDTFAFKKSVPGQFGDQSVIPIEEEEEEELASDPMEDQHDDRSEISADTADDMMSDEEQSPPMPGSLPQAVNPMLVSPQKSPTKLIMPGTPGKPLLDLEGDWAEQLQRTISPRKQNREILRDAQDKVLLDKAFSPIKPNAAPQVNFRSSIDIMNSIFKPAIKTNNQAEPDFEFPYAKRSKTFHANDEDMSEQDRVWHDSFKPHFTTDGKIMYRTSKLAKNETWAEIAVAGNKRAIVAVGQQQSSGAYNIETVLGSCRFELQNGVPSVKHSPVPFSQLVSSNQGKKVADIYNLAQVLFDDYEDEFTRGLSGPLQKQYAHRIRRDRLTQYLSSRIVSIIGVGSPNSPEHTNPIRAAILRLTAHDIHGACEMLKNSRNFRLLLLVSQLDNADETFMKDVKAQLDAWRDQKSLSEIDCDIRALYEICAGNVTVSQGKEGKNIPVEDRAETFNISTRFGLSWLQAFALGLFYGREEKNNGEGIGKIEDAVRHYQARCDRGEEPVKPSDNDVTWSLLKFYASKHDKKVTAPEFPAALQGLAMSWEHSSLFNFYQASLANLAIKKPNIAKADELAETVASELSASGDIAAAVYALIHISNPTVRKDLIQDLLDRFAAILPGPDAATSDSAIALWQRLTIDLRIPTSWIYMSKARYAASSTNMGGDNISELRYLVAAEAWDPAHECLLKRVAPSFVIDEDYVGLQEVCSLFGDDPVRKISTWYDGGDVFKTFGRLMTGTIDKTDAAAISALRKRLVALGNRHSKDTNARGQRISLGQLGQHDLEEHVAIKEMANALARLNTQGGVVGSTKDILELPLTQDVRMEMSMLDPNSAASAKSQDRTKGLGVRETPQDQDVMDEDGA